MSKSVPTTNDLLLRTPLYEATEYEGDEVYSVAGSIFSAGTYDTYCTQCQKESTFKIQPPERPKELVRSVDRENLIRSTGGKVTAPAFPNGLYCITGTCSRIAGHIQYFIFLAEIALEMGAQGKFVTKKRISKIGQFPSYADVDLAKIKKYSGMLERPLLGELSRAIGLASHGIGVGSYVYLRRIFERLVEDAHVAARADHGWDEEAYGKSRMAEKISLLRHHLPPFLVDHAQMYGLLSRGIHELTEQECLAHFDTVRIGIELILDEKLAQREQAKKLEKAKAALAGIARGT